MPRQRAADDEVVDLPEVERLLGAAAEGADSVLARELGRLSEDCGTPRADLRRTFDALWARNPSATRDGVLRLLRSLV